jgi:hypothetical protein
MFVKRVDWKRPRSAMAFFESAETFGRYAEPGRDVMLSEALQEGRRFPDEPLVAFQCGVVPERNLFRLFFDNPVLLHVADVEGGDVREDRRELLELRETVFKHDRVFDRGDGEVRLATVDDEGFGVPPPPGIVVPISRTSS